MKKMKKLLSMALILVLCIASMAVNVSAATADTLSPIDTVRVDLNTGLPYSDGDTTYPLTVKSLTASGYDREYLMKFDVSTVKSATLKVRINTNGKSKYVGSYIISPNWTSKSTDFSALNLATTRTNIRDAYQCMSYGGADAFQTFNITEDMIKNHSVNGQLAVMIKLVANAESDVLEIMAEPTLVVNEYKPEEVFPIREAFVDVQNKVVKTAGDANYNRVVTHTASGTSYDEVYLAKFDVSTVESATFSYNTFRQNSLRYTAIHVLKDVWTDTGVNFDNIQRVDANKYAATGSGNSGYTINHTVELTSDIINEYIEADGTITLLVFVKYSGGTTIDSTVSIADGYKPSLINIIRKAAPTPTNFSFKKANGKIQVSGNPVYVKDSAPTVDSFSTATEVTEYNQLNLSFKDKTGAKSFFTFDLTGIDKSKIDKFTFNLNVYVGSGSGNGVFYVKKVTQAWNNGEYETEDTDLAAQWYNAIGSLSYSYDITETVKNLEGDTLILLVEPKAANIAGDGAIIRWNSPEHDNPYIGVEYAVEPISSKADVTTSGTLYVEKMLVAGTAEEPTPVTPILAVYEGDQLSNVNVGEELTCNGEETKITLDIPVNALSTGEYEVKFFIWDNLVSLVPLVEAEPLN